MFEIFDFYILVFSDLLNYPFGAFIRKNNIVLAIPTFNSSPNFY